MSIQEIDTSQIIEKTAQNIYQIINKNKEKIKDIAEQVFVNWSIFLNKQKNFQALQYVSQKLNQHKRQLKKAKDGQPKDFDNEISAWEQTKNMLKQIVNDTQRKEYQNAAQQLELSIYKLQSALFSNDGLNKKFVINYIIYNRGQPIVYELDAQQAIKYSYSPSKGIQAKIQFTHQQLKQMVKDGKAKIADIDREIVQEGRISEERKILFHTYQQAYRRYNKSKNHTIYININNHSFIFYISNKGDLAEGYARFLFVLKNFKYTDEELRLYDFIVRGVVPVTNQSGFFSEDISDNGIERAIKSYNASAMSMPQIGKLAEQILDLLNGAVTKESFIKYLTKSDNLFFTGNQRNGLITSLKEGSKIYVKEEIDKIIHEITGVKL